MIEVETDGAIVEFPDDTPPEIIKQILSDNAKLLGPNIPGGTDIQQEQLAGLSPEPPPKPPTSIGAGFLQGFENDFLAAQQGVSPIVRDINGKLNFEVAPDTDRFAFFESGKLRDPENQIVLVDPDTGQDEVFLRNPEREEGPATGLGRILAPGFLTGPPTRLPGLAAPAIAAPRLDLPRNLANTSLNRAVVSIRSTLKDSIMGTPIKRGAERTILAMERSLEDIAAGAGAGDKALASTVLEAGETLAKGARGFKTQFQERSLALLERLNKLVPEETSVALKRTAETIQEPLEKFKNAPNIGRAQVPEQFSKFLDDIVANEGSLTFGQVRDFRKFVGQMQVDNSAFPGIAKSQWKRLYGALSDDLRVAASEVGPRAANAFDRHNKFFRSGIKRIDGALKKLLDPAAGEGALFNQVFSATKTGTASASVRKLVTIRRSLSKGEWDDVASVLIRRLGNRPTAGDDAAFSLGAFITNWNKMSKGAKSAVFGGTRYAKNIKDIDSLARFAERFQKIQSAENASRTAGQVINAGLGALGLSSGASAAAAVGVSGFTMSKLLASDRFLRTLNVAARMMKAKQGLPASVNALPRVIARFERLAAAEPRLAADIEDFIVTLRAGEEPVEPEIENQ